jgi:hypothetical protein
VNAVEVLGPKGPYKTADLPAWAKSQLAIADDVLDNPGGGLLFATQTIGQVKAALQEDDEDRWAELVGLLDQVEADAVRRRFSHCRELLLEARSRLG